MTKVAYIPARGGSKRIPQKNIRAFNGVPALGRVIDVIASTGLFDKIVVSTDSQLIRDVATLHSASVIDRSTETSGDLTGLLDVVRGDGELIDQIGGDVELLACILPTALLMDPADLATAVKMVIDGLASFVISVGRFRYPIHRALEINEQFQIAMVSPENYLVRSQDLPERHHDAGQFYVGTREAWNERHTMFDQPSTAIVIDDWRVQDIDVEADWTRAEKLWRVLESE